MHGMRPFGALIGMDEARARLLDAARPVARVDELPLREACGRVCAQDVAAPFDVPPFARATMDGYAMWAADGAAPRKLVGEVPAGATSLPRIGPGEAARIATGAPLPPGADAVVKVEQAAEEHGQVRAQMPPRPGQFVDPAGVDLAKGARVVSRGEVLTPARLGLLASVGLARVRVVARPRVALLSSGDELLSPGAPPEPLRIFDSNTTTLGALFAAAGGAVEALPRLPDEREAMREALVAAAGRADLVVVSGGASVGARDHAAGALAEAGEVLFHGVRVKPGKPMLAGRIGSALVVGLPGNPTSALSNAHLFVVPALRRMAGLPAAAASVTRAPLAVEARGEPDRFLVLPVKLDAGRVVPTFKSSGALTSIAASDGWIGVPEGTTLAAGTPVDVHPW
ncbi:MAG: molybdopterin molybdotransferase [Thermoplasmata archaeon]|jgi:molybdenum cofactor synthesis domain-containing protein|nr:molybdopterin molybdotransferase [Thermoplasmata archaeon]